MGSFQNRNVFYSKVLQIPKLIFTYFKYRLLGDEYFLKIKYFKVFGVKLNLKNPISFNEKLQWLKLNDRTELHTLCADKFGVRDYIKKEIGEEYLIPLVFDTENVLEINDTNMPDFPVIIKTNHDSGSYFILKDKKQQDWIKIRKELKKALARNYYYLGKEWQYKNIKPRVIVEKLLIAKDGSLPNDFKFHCINGKVAFIQVDINRQLEHSRNIYDINWELLDMTYVYKRGGNIEAPKKLIKMIQLAEKISSKFHFARVDFYEVDCQVYFGEITFHPESGFGQIIPEKWSYKFGNMLNLPSYG